MTLCRRTNMRPLGRLVLAAFLLVGTSVVRAQTAQSPGSPESRETVQQFAARTKWWREARFGMFIHWGLYAVPADASKGLAEWYMNNFQVQVKDYEKFAPQFDPERFDAKQWVKTAKEAGMKYIVITTKHHDGFDMFGAHNSDYTIAKSTPFHRDPMLDLSVECRRQGIKLCFYHSIMDWHHPDYLPRRPWEKETRPAAGADFDRYRAYLKEQLRELITTYKPAVIWFDGEWEETWTHAMGLDLYRYVRSLDPTIMVNNRVDKGRSGMAGINISNAFAGDFGTPEQEVPPQGFADDRLWETCMTMNDTWGYARNDHHFKSAEQLIHTLCDVAHKGGNFLLNVGPTDLGEFPPESVNLLATMGEWMKKNHAAIYGTSKSPFKKLSFDGKCTQKGDRLYLHVFHWPENGLMLEGLKTPISSARVLATGEKLALSGPTPVGNGGVLIARPKILDPYATVIELRTVGPLVVEPVSLAQKPVNSAVFLGDARK